MDTQHPGVGSDGRLFSKENLAVRSFLELRRRTIRRDQDHLSGRIENR